MHSIEKGELYSLNTKIQILPQKGQIKPKVSEKKVLELTEHPFGLGRLKNSYAPSEFHSRYRETAPIVSRY